MKQNSKRNVAKVILQFKALQKPDNNSLYIEKEFFWEVELCL